jgi:hypothetical protein
MRPADRAARAMRREPLPAERRLAESRAQIEDILIPDPEGFPRSHTMRLLAGRNGKAVAAGALAALFTMKPRLALSLVRFLPLGRLMPLGLLARRMR